MKITNAVHALRPSSPLRSAALPPKPTPARAAVRYDESTFTPAASPRPFRLEDPNVAATAAVDFVLDDNLATGTARFSLRLPPQLAAQVERITVMEPWATSTHDAGVSRRGGALEVEVTGAEFEAWRQVPPQLWVTLKNGQAARLTLSIEPMRADLSTFERTNLQSSIENDRYALGVMEEGLRDAHLRQTTPDAFPGQNELELAKQKPRLAELEAAVAALRAELDPLLEKADAWVWAYASQDEGASKALSVAINAESRASLREKNLVETIQAFAESYSGDALDRATADLRVELTAVRRQLAEAKAAKESGLASIRAGLSDLPARDAFLARAEVALTGKQTLTAVLGNRRFQTGLVRDLTRLAAGDRERRVEGGPALVARYEGEVAAVKERLAKHQAELEALTSHPAVQIVPTGK